MDVVLSPVLENDQNELPRDQGEKRAGAQWYIAENFPSLHQFAAQGMSDPGMSVSKCIFNNSLWSSSFINLFSLGSSLASITFLGPLLTIHPFQVYEYCTQHTVQNNIGTYILKTLNMTDCNCYVEQHSISGCSVNLCCQSSLSITAFHMYLIKLLIH